MAAVVFVLFLVGGLMVRSLPICTMVPRQALLLTIWQIGAAWFMGAKYDGIADKLSQVFQKSTPAVGGPPVMGHEEL